MRARSHALPRIGTVSDESSHVSRARCLRAPARACARRARSVLNALWYEKIHERVARSRWPSGRREWGGRLSPQSSKHRRRVAAAAESAARDSPRERCDRPRSRRAPSHCAVARLGGHRPAAAKRRTAVAGVSDGDGRRAGHPRADPGARQRPGRGRRQRVSGHRSHGPRSGRRRAASKIRIDSRPALAQPVLPAALGERSRPARPAPFAGPGGPPALPAPAPDARARDRRDAGVRKGAPFVAKPSATSAPRGAPGEPPGEARPASGFDREARGGAKAPRPIHVRLSCLRQGATSRTGRVPAALTSWRPGAGQGGEVPPWLCAHIVPPLAGPAARAAGTGGFELSLSRARELSGRAGGRAPAPAVLPPGGRRMARSATEPTEPADAGAHLATPEKYGPTLALLRRRDDRGPCRFDRDHRRVQHAPRAPGSPPCVLGRGARAAWHEGRVEGGRAGPDGGGRARARAGDRGARRADRSAESHDRELPRGRHEMRQVGARRAASRLHRRRHLLAVAGERAAPFGLAAKAEVAARLPGQGRSRARGVLRVQRQAPDGQGQLPAEALSLLEVRGHLRHDARQVRRAGLVAGRRVPGERVRSSWRDHL